MTTPGRPRWPLLLSAAAATAGVVGGVVAARRLAGTANPHILDGLDLRADDVLLEIGSRGIGLVRALAVVEHVAVIDRSQDVVDATCRRNVAALAAGRLEVRLGDPGSLPWADGSFTAAAMHQAVLRLPDLGRALGEVHRVLRPGGRLVRRGLRLCRDHELARMLEAAGFASIDVVSRGIGQQAKAVRP